MKNLIIWTPKQIFGFNPVQTTESISIYGRKNSIDTLIPFTGQNGKRVFQALIVFSNDANEKISIG